MTMLLPLSLLIACASNQVETVHDDALAGATSPAIAATSDGLTLSETELEKATTARGHAEVALLKANQELEAAEDRLEQNKDLLKATDKKDQKASTAASALAKELDVTVEAKRALVDLREAEDELAAKNLELATARRDLARARHEEARADLAITKHNDDAAQVELLKFKTQTAEHAKHAAKLEGEMIALVQEVGEAEKEYAEALSKVPQPNLGG